MKPHKPLPVIVVVLIDILVLGAMLLTFAFFHHVRQSYGIGESDGTATYGIIDKPDTEPSITPAVTTTVVSGTVDPIIETVTDENGGTSIITSIPSIDKIPKAAFSSSQSGVIIQIEAKDVSDILGVMVDGIPLEEETAYTFDEERMTVALTDSYFKSVPVGDHTVSLVTRLGNINADLYFDAYDRSGDFGKQFAELFSMDDGIYTDETTYRSHDIYIKQEYFSGLLSQRKNDGSSTIYKYTVNYYVFDVYIRNIENFVTSYSTKGTKSFNTLYDGMTLAITGDYYLYSEFPKYVVRNGVLLKNPPSSVTADILVLYYDGVMKTYEPGTYSWDDILAQSPYQVWTFGPSLLNDDGTVKDSSVAKRYNTNVWTFNPRSAVGYVEPGHYVFVAVEGRRYNNSAGVNMEALAQIFYDHGCTVAYNFDGGMSAQAGFKDEYHQLGNDVRSIYDVLGISEVKKDD